MGNRPSTCPTELTDCREKSMPPVPRDSPTPPSGWPHLLAGLGPGLWSASGATTVASQSEWSKRHPPYGVV
eukprot:CAMPEP_0174301436 /NCGR_PEP_ID=MMETSP0809-20121228/59045_1 /TAXON_ID=73025 ORGANISM="Eutreptiella gymnastica-like, Strain CCMP1594" /NCGR_SAMPLE_ID=MMETSP0809 /ASSEMBLY_ACC=CAM_ASM_000658 /LENGTH=70 /DNA_ID=CAMNT_0015407183 /DNA_START=1451 /DNA_END=1663 /DNA_ORIENTATION=-